VPGYFLCINAIKRLCHKKKAVQSFYGSIFLWLFGLQFGKIPDKIEFSAV
jgi:hypothetical protein